MNQIKTNILLLTFFLLFASTAQAATYTVTTTADAGAGSLRDAIAQANQTSDDDTIVFAIPTTDAGCTANAVCAITLTSGELVIGSTTTTTGKLTISNSSGANKLIISGNNQSRVFFVRPNGDLTLDGVTITKGNARGATNPNFNNIGGGIISYGRVAITNSIVTNNSTTGDSGGVHNGSGTLIITNSTISNNSAGNSCGGVLNGGTLILTNSTLSNNSAALYYGGGIVNYSTGTVTITNSTLSGNSARTSGGGIINYGTATMTNATISNNSAATGGGIYVYGDLDNNGSVKTIIRNTIIGANSATNGQPDINRFNSSDAFISNGNNLIGNAADTRIPIRWQAGDKLGQQPNLAPLGNYGGATQTQPLRVGSPAINAGNNCVLTANGCGDNNVALTTDQRGLARSVNGSADIGAVELQANENFVSKTALDFDGDGKAELSVFRPSNGVWYSLNLRYGVFSAVQFGLSDDQLAPADYDGDGKTDIAVYRNGTWYILQSATNTIRYVQFGLAEDKPRPADFDGDDKADICVFRPSNGTWYRLNSSNNQFVAAQFGLSSDVPVIADFDGDGKADIAVFRPSNGVWYWLQSKDNAFRAAQFGTTGDIPVVGDYDGDGSSDIAVYRPSNGTWYAQRSQAGFTATQIGQFGDRPAPGDYDGDGKTDFAVYRNGVWQILRSSDNNFAAANFGLASDAPLPSVYLP